MTKTKRVPPLLRSVRLAHPGKATLPEAAKQLGVSPKTLRSLIGHPDLPGVPGNVVMAGSTRVYVYSGDDVNRLRRYLDERQAASSKPVDPEHERARRERRQARMRLNSRAYYARQQRLQAIEEGNADAVNHYEDMLAAVAAELEALK